MKPISSDWAERHPVSRFNSCSVRRFFICKASAHSAFARYDQLQRTRKNYCSGSPHLI
jgi:hypothetical protein